MKRGPYATRPGTVAWLVAQYMRSPGYSGLSQATKAQRDPMLHDLVANNGGRLLAQVRQGDIILMRDHMARVPNYANNWLKCMKLLFAYAVEVEAMAASPAEKVKRLKRPNPDGHRTWQDHEVEAYLAHHAIGTLPHLVMTLALYTGAARADLVRLGPANVRGGRLSYRRAKMRGRVAPLVDIPIAAPLAEALAILPPRMTFLETRAGLQRSEKALGGDFADWVAQAGLGARDDLGRALTLHGLRKAMARRLAEAGATPQEIMSVLGHQSIAMAAHYSAAYDRSRAADSALARIDAGPTTNVVRIRRVE